MLYKTQADTSSATFLSQLTDGGGGEEVQGLILRLRYNQRDVDVFDALKVQLSYLRMNIRVNHDLIWVLWYDCLEEVKRTRVESKLRSRRMKFFLEISKINPRNLVTKTGKEYLKNLEKGGLLVLLNPRSLGTERYNRYALLSLKQSWEQPKSKNSFPPEQYIGVGYADKGSSRDSATDGSPSWQEVAVSENSHKLEREVKLNQVERAWLSVQGDSDRGDQRRKSRWRKIVRHSRDRQELFSLD